MLLAIANRPTKPRYVHPEVDRIQGVYGIYWGSFQDHTLSTPGLSTIIFDLPQDGCRVMPYSFFVGTHIVAVL